MKNGVGFSYPYFFVIFTQFLHINEGNTILNTGNFGDQL
jgi:hypothetical protein